VNRASQVVALDGAIGHAGQPIDGTPRQWGVGDPAAGLTAEIAISVLQLSFHRGLDTHNRLPQLMRN